MTVDYDRLNELISDIESGLCDEGCIANAKGCTPIARVAGEAQLPHVWLWKKHGSAYRILVEDNNKALVPLTDTSLQTRCHFATRMSEIIRAIRAAVPDHHERVTRAITYLETVIAQAWPAEKTESDLG